MAKDKDTYKLSDLLNDEFFIRWVFKPDKESHHYWTNLMDRNPELIAKINEAREVLNLMDYKHKYKLDNHEYTDMLEALVKENGSAKNKQSKGKGVSLALKIAASFLVVAMIGTLFFYADIFNTNTDSLTGTTIEIRQTHAGEKLTLKLPDGTKVKLNSLTNLSFASEFSGESREVFLEGEAYFDVVKDPSRPFVIHTKDITTTVLGTEFNVRSYDDEENIEVAVVEGKVRVGKRETDDYVYLTPNEVSTYVKSGRKLSKEKRDLTNVVAWYKNILVFDKTTSDEMWEILEDWYGVTITVKRDKEIEGKYSGIYENEPLNTVLRGISYTSGFDYEIDKNKNVLIK